MGRRWASNLHPSVKGAHHWYFGHFAYAEPSGQVIRFRRINGVWKHAGLPWIPGGWEAKEGHDRKDLPGYILTEVTTTKLVLKSPDGVERDFEYTSRGASDPILTKIRYPDGYEIVLAYNPDRVVTSATDTDGYSINFTYDSRGLLEIVTAPDGSEYKYEYKDLPNSAWAIGVTGIIGNTWEYFAILSAVVYPDDTPATDTDNPRKEYSYDHATNSMALTSLKDERGITVQTWDYAWGTTGWRAISSVGPGGNELITVNETIDRQQVTVTNALGKQTIYNYSNAGKVPKIDSIDGVATASCAASTAAVGYDSSGRITSLTGREGQLSTRTLDTASGLPLTIVQGSGTPEQETTTLAWDTTLRKPTLIERPDLKAEFTYDADWNVTEQKLTDTTTQTVPYSTNGSVRTWAYTWSAEGLLLTVDGPLTGAGDTITYTYDASANLASVTDEVGLVTTVNTVDGMGRPTQITDPNGLIITLAYSPRGWVETLVENPGPSARTTSFTYDAAGNLTRADMPNGGWFTYTYNDSAWLTEVNASTGDKIQYQHDLLGNATRTDYANSSGTSLSNMTMQYDELGRITQLLGGAGDVEQYAYDRSDRQTSLTDGLSRTWLTGFDALNRVISKTDPDTDIIQLDWEQSGGLDTFTDGRSLVTSYVRNGFGETIREISPDSGTTDYWYDAAGRVTRMLDAAGNDANFTYDNAGRVLTKTYPTQTTLNTTYSYDDTSGGNAGLGRLTGISNSLSGKEYSYNIFGQMTDQLTNVSGLYHSIGYEYVGNGELNKLTLPSGREVHYTYDGIGRTIGLDTKANSGASLLPVISSVTRAPYGPITSFTYGNGAVATYSLDTSYRLSSISLGNGATTLLDKDYAYDANSRVTGITDLLDSTATATYTYYDDGRLKRATGPWGDAEWAYDAVGNRLTDKRYLSGVLASTETYAYEAGSNRLTSVTDASSGLIRSISYTADGSINQDARPSGDLLDYNYNQARRLESIFRSTAGQTFSGTSGDDTVTGAAGADTINGLAGDDQLIGGDGSDTIDGGAGYDTAVYYSTRDNYTFTQNSGGPVVATHATSGEVDQLTDVEAVWFQSSQQWFAIATLLSSSPAGGQTLTGTTGDDTLTGGANGDALNGLGGNDQLVGNDGSDLVDGGTGYDTVVYYSVPANYTFSSAEDGSILAAHVGSGEIDRLSNVEAVWFDTSQEWFAINDLVSDTTPVSYHYDAFGHRVLRDSVAEGSRNYVFATSGLLLGEYDGATGAVIAEYIWLENQLVAQVDSAGTISYVQTGHLGQPLLVMDGAAAVTWRGETSPFGTYVYTSGPGSDPDLRLPGQWLEAGSGLYHNWHRDYDPSLGRYIEADPLGIAAGQSVYGYVGQDPLNAVDPTGLFAAALGGRRRGGGRGRFGGPAAAAVAGLTAAYTIYNAPFGAIGDAMSGAGGAVNEFTDNMADEIRKICRPLVTPRPVIISPPVRIPLDDFDDPPVDCDKSYASDTATCNAISGRRGRQRGAACHASAADRFAACITGRPPGEWPPLNVWNN